MACPLLSRRFLPALLAAVLPLRAAAVNECAMDSQRPCGANMIQRCEQSDLDQDGIIDNYWGACVDPTVAAGPACTETQVTACPVEHGKGVQRCDVQGQWGPCQVTGCDEQYHQQGQTCARDTSMEPTSEPAPPAGSPALPPPLPPGRPADVQHDVNQDLQTQLGTTVKQSEGSQNNALEKSNDAIASGANQAATVAAVFCAEAGNQASNSPEQSAGNAQACKEQFKAANQMLDLRQKHDPSAKFSPDEATMNHEKTKAVFDDFEKKFGVSGNDYVNRMLSARGAEGEYRNLMGSVLSGSQWEKMMAGAPGASAKVDAEKYEVTLTGPKKRNDQGLRDELRKRLVNAKSAAPAETRRPASADSDRHLEALRAEEAFKFLPKDAKGENAAGGPDLSLFDVIRRKYGELAKRQNLVPGRSR